jgi:hypothetical protein
MLYGLVAPANAGMLALARRLGFEVEHVAGGTTVIVSLDLKRIPAGALRDPSVANVPLTPVPRAEIARIPSQIA